ncbi:MAG: hypothetical protein QNJ72_10865 [Pleurocapsa sp. MO_226.B13]|nr:hypothetical protein [Pleurocapsa sp. MO_226.B13]
MPSLFLAQVIRTPLLFSQLKFIFGVVFSCPHTGEIEPTKILLVNKGIKYLLVISKQSLANSR